MTFLLWLKKFGAPIGKAVLSFSLLVATLALAVDYGAVAARLGRAKDDDAKMRIFKELLADPAIDAELSRSLNELVEGQSYAITVEQAEKLVALRAFAQGSSSNMSSGASRTVQDIKRNPLYRDPGEKESSNWFAKGFERLGEYLERLFARQPRPQPGQAAPDVGGIVSVLKVIVYIVLAGVLGLFLFFVVKHFRWKTGLARQTKALLAEDEPELSRDEYLAEADRLATSGEHRKAVRYLYLACLLLFDEHHVARFVRGETNWEHLRRISASPSLPPDLDFEPPTRKFDHVWYGMRIEGVSDVEAMRNWYLQIADRLRRKAA